MLFHRFKRFGRAFEHAHRFRTIMGVFLKYGYQDLALRLPLPSPWRLPFRKIRQEQEQIALLTPPQRLRRAFEELGPTFIKLGQLLSTRAHLLPRPYLVELAKLHDEVPPIAFDQIQALIESELGGPLAQSFSAIDPNPNGSASIAQVHRSVLLSGEPCVVKVQRPGIEKLVRVDLEIMAQLAALLEKHAEGWALYRPTAIIAEFAQQMEQELDFAAEAAHMERFAHQFAADPTVRVPRVFHETSTQRLLTMQCVEGIKASRIDLLEAAALDRPLIASRITELVMKQIFLHGFFHADPHPGNIHVLPGNVICFFDFGMVGFLDQRTRQNFANFVMGIAQRDERATAAALLKLAGAELDPPRPGFESDVAEFMHRHFYRPLGEMVFSKLINHLFHLTTKHGLAMPADLFMVLKALGLMENVVRRLDPEHDIVAQSRPLLREVRLRRIGPRRLLREWLEFSDEAAAFLRELPQESRRVLSQVKEGRLKLLFHHAGLDPLTGTMERISNRLAFAVVLAALIIASAVMVHAKVPPMWHGMPVIGVLGYLVAAVMGFWLLIAILRHGKM